MSLLEEILPRLRNVLDQIHGLVKGLHFDPRNQQHLLAGALLGRILEEAEGIYVMLERQDSACGFILLRSLLEAHVDLINISSDPTYIEFMNAAFLDQQRFLLEAALEKGSKSPFLANLPGNTEAAEQLDWVRSTLKQLEERQIKPLSVRKRFKRADQLDYYEGPYAHLCWHSHVLESRHLRLTDAGVVIRAFAPIDDDDAHLISDTTAGISANCVASVKKLLEGEPVTGLERLSEALGNLRNLWREDEGTAPPGPATDA
ncbi:MAG TPA: DUF5677 domain-containing protein [Thermoanaerobaculia bacterium]